MRKPRNLDKYTDKQGAVDFLEELLAKVKEEPESIRLHLKLSYNRWDPNWEK